MASFGKALEALKKNKAEHIRLPYWRPEIKIKLKRPSKSSDMTAAYLYQENGRASLPWLPNNLEILNNRWEIIPCQSDNSEGENQNVAEI